MATKAQEWARKRNEARWLLTGIAVNMRVILNNPSLTSGEIGYIKEAIGKIEAVTTTWKERNKQSKKMYIDSIPLIREKK